MKGLILKDLLFIKGNLKSLIIFIICMGIFVLNSDGNTTAVLFFLPFFFTMTCISTFSYDEYNKWNGYAITLPGGRETIVRSKYVMTLLMIIVGFVASLLVLLFITSVNAKANFSDGFDTLLGSVVGMMIMISIMYPLIYKFGSEKGRIVLFVIVVLISMLSGLLLNISDLNKIVPFLNKYGFFLIPIVCIVVIYISYRISLHIYKNKEF